MSTLWAVETKSDTFGSQKQKDSKLTTSPELAINKIGHNLHDLEPEFQAVSYDKRVAMICKELGMEVPLCMQSMYIFKQPFIGGEVGAH